MYKEEDIENEIIAALKEEIHDFEILTYQNDIANFKSLHSNGSILISYSATNPTSSGFQEYDNLQIGIDVIYKNLITHIGAFSLLRIIRGVMKTLDFTLSSQIFLDISGNEWHYSLIYSKTFIYER